MFKAALKGWQLMGGLDWAALPIVAEIIGVNDIESFVELLVLIRDKRREESQ
jgi:hypothetical protein